MLATSLIPELKRKYLALKNIQFQQDGATAHTGHNIMDYLRTKFCGCVISCNGNIAWPACPLTSVFENFTFGNTLN